MFVPYTYFLNWDLVYFSGKEISKIKKKKKNLCKTKRNIKEYSRVRISTKVMEK